MIISGGAVALEGSTALIGAWGRDNSTGAVYVFTGSGDIWTQRTVITAPDGHDNDAFGCSVDLEGNTAVIGAYGHNSYMGAAYVFTGSADIWGLQDELTADDGIKDDAFGVAVCYSDGTLCVGQSMPGSATQKVYVFTRNGTIWSPQAKLTGSHSGSADLFGVALNYRDNVAVIGAPFYDNFTGSVYVFTRTGTTWKEQNWWQASEVVSMGIFGISVARDGNTILVGSLPLTSQNGQAYVYNTEEKSPTLHRGVGGEVSEVNRVGVIWPGLVLIPLCAAGAALLWNRRRKA
jgi:hypothetical protein